MIRTTAVRLGIPVSSLIRRVLTSTALVLLVGVTLLVSREMTLGQTSALQEYETTLRTIFELSSTDADISDGLVALSRERGYERIWVLNATGEVRASSRPREIGTRLEDAWWNQMRSESPDMQRETVIFGTQELDLFFVSARDTGVRVAIVAQDAMAAGSLPARAGMYVFAAFLLWIGLAALFARGLHESIGKPTRALDEKLLGLLRGNGVSDTQWDRLQVEIGERLGGHAACVLDLARSVDYERLTHQAATVRFDTLFNTLPIPAFVLDHDRRIVEVNEAMATAATGTPEQLLGKHLSVLGTWLPVETLSRWLDTSGSTPVGLRRVPCAFDAALEGSPNAEVSPSILYLTLASIVSGGRPGHIVLIEGWGDSSLDNMPEAATLVEKAVREAVTEGNPQEVASVDNAHAASPPVDRIPSLISSAFSDVDNSSAETRSRGDGRPRAGSVWRYAGSGLSLRPSA